MSSRFSEYTFQMMRSATRDSKVVAGMQATHHMRAHATLLGFEAKGVVMEPMMSKRGIAKKCMPPMSKDLIVTSLLSPQQYTNDTLMTATCCLQQCSRMSCEVLGK